MVEQPHQHGWQSGRVADRITARSDTPTLALAFPLKAACGWSSASHLSSSVSLTVTGESIPLSCRDAVRLKPGNI